MTRACVAETEKQFYIILDIHHLIFDGTSSKVLLEDFIEAYNGNDLKEEKITLLNQSVREGLIDKKEKEESDKESVNLIRTVLYDDTNKKLANCIKEKY